MYHILFERDRRYFHIIFLVFLVLLLGSGCQEQKRESVSRTTNSSGPTEKDPVSTTLLQKDEKELFFPRVDPSKLKTLPTSKLGGDVKSIFSGEAKFLKIEGKSYTVAFTLKNITSTEIEIELGPIRAPVSGKTHTLTSPSGALLAEKDGEWISVASRYSYPTDIVSYHRLLPGEVVSRTFTATLDDYHENIVHQGSRLAVSVEIYVIDGIVDSKELIIPLPSKKEALIELYRKEASLRFKPKQVGRSGE